MPHERVLLSNNMLKSQVTAPVSVLPREYASDKLNRPKISRRTFNLAITAGTNPIRTFGRLAATSWPVDLEGL